MQSVHSGGNFRVLVTETDYKHSIALARYIKREFNDVHLTGVSRNRIRYARLYKCFDEVLENSTIEAALRAAQFDMVIPVGSTSVLEASRVCPQLAVLPSAENVDSAFQKQKTISLAMQCGVPVPRSQHLLREADLEVNRLSFPCVVKSSSEEASYKKVRYCHTAEQTIVAVRDTLERLREDGTGVLVQEYIEGVGHGFFALFDHGRPVATFMHQRLREFPPTGGPSTAARAFQSARLEELGVRLLRELQWNGVAMVEFRYEPKRQDFVLMEINGKFWGSLELALASGVNFGAELIRVRRGEMPGKTSVNPETRFYWPLDGDLQALWSTGSMLNGVKEYFAPGARTNLGQSIRADLIKCARLLRDLVKGNEQL